MNETTTTETALIDAARALFAEHGYAGTSVRAVTTAAGANLGAITYHFGSKRELYDRVVESVVGPLAERLTAAAEAPGDALDRAAGVVRVYFEYVASNPDLPQLMMQELVLGGVPADVVAAPLKRVHAALTQLVVEGQASGVVRPGPQPVLGIFILSIPVHLGLLQRALQAHVGLDLLSAPLRGQVMESAVGFVRQGLAATEAGEE
jgi:AcrR family transcriptional regulator